MPTGILLSNGNVLDIKRTFHIFAANGTNENRWLPLCCEILNEICARQFAKSHWCACPLE